MAWARLRFCHTSVQYRFVSNPSLPHHQDRPQQLTISAPRSKATELNNIQHRARGNAADIFGRIRRYEHLSPDRVADAVGDEQDRGGHCLLRSACDIGWEEGPDHCSAAVRLVVQYGSWNRVAGELGRVLTHARQRAEHLQDVHAPSRPLHAVGGEQGER